VVDHSLRTATVYATQMLKQQTHAAVDSKALKLDLRPTGRTHLLQQWSCVEHDLRLVLPAEIGGEKLTFEMEGTLWLVRQAREHKEISSVLQLMQDPDFFMSIPPLAKAAPIQAQGISEAIRRLAPLGLMCSVDVDLKYEGQGRVAQLSKKLASRISMTFDDYSTEPIPAGAFDPPPGYRVVRP